MDANSTVLTLVYNANKDLLLKTVDAPSMDV